jgi:hypothetical protein
VRGKGAQSLAPPSTEWPGARAALHFTNVVCAILAVIEIRGNRLVAICSGRFPSNQRAENRQCAMGLAPRRHLGSPDFEECKMRSGKCG